MRGLAHLQDIRTAYLWTSGFVPRLQTYDGKEVPRPLLIDVMQEGKQTWQESLEDARQRCRDRMASLPPPLQELDGGPYPVELSSRLEALGREMSADQAAR